MENAFSKNMEDLFVPEIKKYIDSVMIDDIYHFMTISKATKAELTYDSKILHIIKVKHNGIKLFLEYDGKMINMIPNN